MTREIRTLIDLSDIQGIEIECQKCNAKMMLPITSQLAHNDGRCPHCHAEWFGTNYDARSGQAFAAAVGQINDFMKRIAHLTTKERSDIYVPIRLHVGTTLLAETSDHASRVKD